MADEFNNNQKDNVNFKNDWLQNSVELAALGAILTGAGSIAVNGDFGAVGKGSKKVVGAMSRGADQYMKRSGTPASKLLYLISKGTYGNLKNKPLPNINRDVKSFGNRVTEARELVKKDKDLVDKIDKEVASRLSNAHKYTTQQKVNAVKLGEPIRRSNVSEERLIKEIREQVEGEEIKRIMDIREGNVAKNPKQSFFNKNQLSKKDLVGHGVAHGLGGLAFGAGISGFHALDRLSGDKEVQNKLENSFDYAGSFLSKRDGKNMEKKANQVKETNRLKELARKFPEGVAAGTGFAGVSVGANKLLDLGSKEEPKQKGSRIIIELGEDDERPVEVPKIASTESLGLAKLAGQKRG